VAVVAGSAAQIRALNSLTAETVLPEGGTLLMLGDANQRQRFAETFEQV
jgi:hypothetical protein